MMEYDIFGSWRQITVKFESKYASFHPRNGFENVCKWQRFCLGHNVLVNSVYLRVVCHKFWHVLLENYVFYNSYDELQKHRSWNIWGLVQGYLVKTTRHFLTNCFSERKTFFSLLIRGRCSNLLCTEFDPRLVHDNLSVAFCVICVSLCQSIKIKSTNMYIDVMPLYDTFTCNLHLTVFKRNHSFFDYF